VSAPLGHGVIDPSSCSGLTIFDLHSPQFNRFVGLDILGASDQTGKVFNIACDITTLGGHGGNTKNSILNYIGHITAGKNGTFVSMAGTVVATNVVTLNTVEHINAFNQGVGFISIGAYCDNNSFLGMMRSSLNQNNAVGVDFAADATCYANVFQVLQVDTFAGNTGRIGVRFGAGGSRNYIGHYFNNPVAEGGAVVASGDSWGIGSGDWQETGTPSSALSSTFRRQTQVTSYRTATYRTTVAADVTLTNGQGVVRVTITDGVGFTMGAPAGAGTNDRITFSFLQSSNNATGTITWNSAYKVQGGSTGFTGPTAQNKYRSVSFFYDGTNWIEYDRSTADVG
jgi:hypothetical protein